MKIFSALMWKALSLEQREIVLDELASQVASRRIGVVEKSTLLRIEPQAGSRLHQMKSQATDTLRRETYIEALALDIREMLQTLTTSRRFLATAEEKMKKDPLMVGYFAKMVKKYEEKIGSIELERLEWE